MFVLGDKWEDGYLDYHRGEGEVRIAVGWWCPLRKLSDVFVEQPRSLRRVINYVREVGVISVIRKIRSRMAERTRNARVLAIGVGRVIESDGDPGESVVFIAPCHPLCVERVVVPRAWTMPTGDVLDAACKADDGLKLFSVDEPVDSAFDGLEELNSFSARSLPSNLTSALTRAREILASLPVDHARTLELGARSPVAERRTHQRSNTSSRSSLRAAIFGLGHYAKTCIVPFVPREIEIDCIHEIEPTQIGRAPSIDASYDTSPVLRDGERYDVVFVAGYHHTHAPLAIDVLKSGGAAVIEKPMATTQAQLDGLMSAVTNGKGRAYAGFHMRYNPLWRMAREDIGVSRGDPIHYSCIVYEIPLGRLHWYNWPSSGSRLISNGCHWFDHFLFLNDYSNPTRHEIWFGGNGEIHSSVELENGAVMNMVLTDHGSPRIGVQDHIQLRANGVTVRVDHNSRYISEDGFRIIRRKRFNRSRLYGMMYSEICRKILSGEPGDAPKTIQMTTQLMLNLERQLQISSGNQATNPAAAEMVGISV